MKNKKTTERINQTLSIRSRSDEALNLEARKREITEELEKLVAEYAKATGKKHLVRKSKKDTNQIYDLVTDAVNDVITDKK